MSSSSSCHVISTDIPDPLSPHLPIVHCFLQTLKATCRIGTERLYVGSGWTSCLYCPCEGAHRCSSLMNSSLLLEQWPACLVRLILIVFVMGGWWPCSCCWVGRCLQDLFNIARRILFELPSKLNSAPLESVLYKMIPFRSDDARLLAIWKEVFQLSVPYIYKMAHWSSG